MKDKSLSLRKKLDKYISTLFIFLILGCASIDKKEFIPLYLEVSSETFTIPEGYQSYTLLFATSYDYVDNVSTQDMKKLRKKIQRFGKSIGKENLTIWVNKPSSEELNVELGKTYSDRIYTWHKLKLDYSDGPYLVYLSHNPDHPPVPGDFAAAISFSNKTPEYMSESIEYIEANIRRGSISKENIQAINYWLDLKSFVSKNSKSLKELLVKVSEKYI